MGGVGGIGLEVMLVALGLKGHRCPQREGRWWHWGCSDIGGIGVEGTLVCPQHGGVGGIGVGGTLVSPKWGMLMGLGLEGHWCPQHGGVGGIGVGSDIGGIGVGNDVGGIGIEGTSATPKWGTLVALGWK